MTIMVGPKYFSRKGEFFRNLSYMTSSGMGLIQCLQTQERHPPDRRWRPDLRRLIRALESGESFHSAIEANPRLFPEFERAILRAAEESGRLPESFDVLSRYYQEKEALSRRFLALAAYPVLVLHVGVLIFPVEALQNLVLKGEIVGFVASKLFVLGPLYALVFAAAHISSSERGSSWRALIEAVLHRVPLFGSARRHMALARLAAALESMLNAGVPIIQAWELAAPASGSHAILQTVRRILPQFGAGWTPSEILRRSAFFPEMFVNHYATGESSGKLDESLKWLYRYHQEEGTRKMKQAVAAAGGLLYFGVVLFAVWNIFSFYLDYFRQIDEVIPD